MEVIDILTQSRKIFFDCIDICNEKYRQGQDLQFYRDIISEHRKNPNLEVLLASEDFLHRIIDTLDKWDMNKRGAKMANESTIISSIRAHQKRLVNLYQYRLEEIDESDVDKVLGQIREIFCDIKIMATMRRIVGVSKALHFLLPDLVMPIDSANTMMAFYGYNRYSNDAEKEFATFKDIFKKSYKIAKRLELLRADVSGYRWSCSVPKMIDNAIFGYFIKIKNIIKNVKE